MGSFPRLAARRERQGLASLHPGSATEVLCDLCKALPLCAPVSFLCWLREAAVAPPLAVPLAGLGYSGKVDPSFQSSVDLQNGMPREINERTPGPPLLCSEEELCHPTGAGYVRLPESKSEPEHHVFCAGQDQARLWICFLLFPIPGSRESLCVHRLALACHGHRAACPWCPSEAPVNREFTQDLRGTGA